MAGVTEASSDVRADVFALCAKHLDVSVDSLSADATLEELGLCSVDLASLVFVVERRFEVDLSYEGPGDELLPLETLGDFANLVESSVRMST